MSSRILNVAKWTGRGASLALCVTLLGCTTMQVDTAPSKRFADKGYQTFSWRTEVPRGVRSPWRASIAGLPLFRRSLPRPLRKKATALNHQVATFSSAMPLARGWRRPGACHTRTPAQRRGDQPNARWRGDGQCLCAKWAAEVASLMISFEDGDNLASVWSASISQVVENQNQPDLDKIQRKLKSGVTKAFRVLPDATNR